MMSIWHAHFPCINCINKESLQMSNFQQEIDAVDCISGVDSSGNDTKDTNSYPAPVQQAADIINYTSSIR